MKIRLCTNNLDLHGDFSEAICVVDDGAQAPTVHPPTDYELQEVHCLGYCYWCQLGPIALVNNKLLT